MKFKFQHPGTQLCQQQTRPCSLPPLLSHGPSGLSVNVPQPPSLPRPVVPRGLAGILRGGWALFFSCEQLPTPKQGPGSQRAFRVTKVGQPGSDSSAHVQEGRHPVDVCLPTPA